MRPPVSAGGLFFLDVWIMMRVALAVFSAVECRIFSSVVVVFPAVAVLEPVVLFDQAYGGPPYV